MDLTAASVSPAYAEPASRSDALGREPAALRVLSVGMEVVAEVPLDLARHAGDIIGKHQRDMSAVVVDHHDGLPIQRLATLRIQFGTRRQKHFVELRSEPMRIVPW